MRRHLRHLTPTWRRAKRLAARCEDSGLSLTPGTAYTLIRANRRDHAFDNRTPDSGPTDA